MKQPEAFLPKNHKRSKSNKMFKQGGENGPAHWIETYKMFTLWARQAVTYVG